MQLTETHLAGLRIFKPVLKADSRLHSRHLSGKIVTWLREIINLVRCFKFLRIFVVVIQTS